MVTLRSGTSTSKPNMALNGEIVDEVVVDDPNMITFWKFRFNRIVFVTHVAMVLYSSCFWIQQGVMPYLTKEFNVDPVTFGYLQTTFALVQLCGGPLYGRFGDLFGSRNALMIGFTAAGLSYLLLGIADSITMLFISRLPSVLMHTMQGGQMVVTDVSDTTKRADSLAKLGFSYGLGFAAGPLVGGFISNSYGPSVSALVSAAVSLFSILFVFTFIPKYTKRVHTKEKSGSAVFNIRKYYALLKSPGAFLLLGVKFFSGIPSGVLQSTFSLVAMETFKLSSKENGIFMSYVGVLGMVIQLIGVGYLSKKFSDNFLLKMGSFICIFAFFFMAFAQTIYHVAFCLAPLMLGMTLKTIVISSALTKTVAHADTGAMLGMNMAVNSLIRTFSPTLGGYLLQWYGFPSVGYLGAVTSTFVTLYLVWKLRD